MRKRKTFVKLETIKGNTLGGERHLEREKTSERRGKEGEPH